MRDDSHVMTKYEAEQHRCAEKFEARGKYFKKTLIAIAVLITFGIVSFFFIDIVFKIAVGVASVVGGIFFVWLVGKGFHKIGWYAGKKIGWFVDPYKFSDDGPIPWFLGVALCGSPVAAYYIGQFLLGAILH